MTGYARRERVEAAAHRKLAAGATASLALARRRSAAALHALRGVRFEAVVFDLDGTLADATAARDDVRSALARVTRAGVHVAIATGRAPSDRALALMRDLVDEQHWARVLVGYRNGAQLGRLRGDGVQTLTRLDGDDFAALRARLAAHVAELEPAVVLVADTPAQLTLHAPAGAHPLELVAIAQAAIAATRARAKVVQSPHNVDIVHPDTSKSRIAALLGAGERPVLRVGDTGRRPGNDFELLADAYGLSVDEVSADLACCWNFLPAGLASVEGTLHYLDQLDTAGAGAVAFGERFFA